MEYKMEMSLARSPGTSSWRPLPLGVRPLKERRG